MKLNHFFLWENTFEGHRLVLKMSCSVVWHAHKSWPSWLCIHNPSPPPRWETALRCWENQVMWDWVFKEVRSTLQTCFQWEMTRGTGGKVHVFVKGSGQPEVQSEWVGTTWFRRLVKKDWCFELEQVCYVLQSARKCSCVDTTRK